MRQWRLAFIALVLTAIIFLALHPARAQGGSPSEAPGLSPYWEPAVSRWESIVLHYAQQRGLDPDLVASVIWKESLGRARSRGPAGAVGLMGVMPFEWRPSAEELENPWTNVFWGARALAHTIRDGQGDLYYSLAAYNGGWEKIHRRSTRNYAADVLNHYVRAVAVRHGFPTDGEWAAIFAAEGVPGPQTITVIKPNRPPARYTERRWIQADIPTVPAGVPPHTTAITFADKQGMECRVNMWLVAQDGSPLVSPSAQTTLSPPAVAHERTATETLKQLPAPEGTPTPMFTVATVVLAGGAELRPGAATWWYPRQTLPAGTAVELIGHDPDFPDWVYVRTVNGASTGWIQIADLEANRELSGLPIITPVPTLTPTPTPPLTPTLSFECKGGPLQLDAWPLEKAFIPDGGWKVTIFVEGHGGDCIYTYAWEGEVKGGPVSGPMTFEVSHTDSGAIIMGTASVTSAGETVEAGLFIKPTGGNWP